MLKKYISLLELVPDVITNAKQNQLPDWYIDNLYRLSDPALIHIDAERIYIPEYVATLEYECDRIFMGTIVGEESPEQYLPPLHMPHILELEYLKQSNIELSAIEINALHAVAVNMVLVYLLASWTNRHEFDNDIFVHIQRHLESPAVFNNYIHEIDVDKNPERVGDTISKIYATYPTNVETPQILNGTGFARSTQDIHHVFSKNFFDSGARPINTQGRYSTMYKCMRYAPIYTTLVALEQARTDITIEHQNYVDYRAIYDRYLSPIIAGEDTASWGFSMGIDMRQSLTNTQDVFFLRRIMGIAVDNMQRCMAQPVIPYEQILDSCTIGLLASGKPVSVLAYTVCLDWAANSDIDDTTSNNKD